MSGAGPAGDADRLGERADAAARGAPPPAGTDEADGRVDAAARALREAWALGREELDSAIRALREEDVRLPPPVLPDDYEILEEIGRGGTGVVYRARQRSLDRFVAVKVLRAGDLLFGSALRRFEREARALARLRHPHIVAIHEVGSADGRLWFSMDLVEGRSLADRLREGALAPALAAHLVAEVAGAVAYVHEHGLVHRDIKPGNILLDREGNPYVTDFGLALEVGSEADLTLTGQIVGTPAYMSPEQARGDLGSVGAATDVYALGAVLYESLTGRRPFQGLSPAEQVYAVIHRDPPAPRRIDGRIPEPLERVCLQAMRKRPGERYASAAALADDLRRFLAGRAVSAEALSAPRRLGRWARGHVAGLGWGLAAALAAALALAPWSAGEDARAVGAWSLKQAARRALARGDVVGWEDAWRQARRLEGRRFPYDVTDARDLAQARIRAAEASWQAGKSQDALDLLDRTIAECRACAAPPGRDDLRRGFEADLRWAQGVAHAAGGDDGEAAKALAQALDLVPSSSSRIEAAAGYATARLAAMAPALRDEGHPGHAAALATARVLLRHRPDAAWKAVREDPGLLAWLLPTAVAPAGPAEALAPGAHLGWLRNTLREAPPGTAEPVLAQTALDASQPLRARRAAAILLGDLADVPSGPAFASLDFEALDLPWDPAEIPTVWAAWQKAGPRTAHRERVLRILEEWRAAERAEPQDALALLHSLVRSYAPDYLRDRTGMPLPTRPEDAAAWWAAHEAEEPWVGLAASLGLPTGAGPPDAEAVLARWPRLDDAGRRRAHALLARLVPATTPVPGIGLRGDVGTHAFLTWCARVPGGDPRRRARAAVARFDPTAGWAIDASEDRFLDLTVDGPSLPLAWERAETPPVQVSLAPPGLGPVRVHPVTRSFASRMGLGWGAGGVEIRWGAQVEAGAGWRSSSGGSRGSDADVAMSVEFTNLGWGTPDPARNEVHLVVVEPMGAGAASWSLADWRRRLAADASRVADEVEQAAAAGGRATWPPSNSALLDRQHWLSNVGLLGMRLPLPEAADALGRLDRALEAGDTGAGVLELQRALLLRARLLAGDARLLAAPSTLERLRKERKGIPDLVDRREAQMWVRVLCEGAAGPARDLAAARLAELEIPEDSAGDLLDAERAGRGAIPPAVRARILRDGAEDRTVVGLARRHPVPSALAALLALGLLAAAVLAALPRRPAWRRLVPAAWLVLLGVAAEGFDVFLAGTDLLPDAAGLALAAWGSLLLARSAGGRARWIPAGLFALGAALALAGPGTGDPLSWARLLAVWGGVAALPGLASRLRGPRPDGLDRRAYPLAFRVLYMMPLVAMTTIGLLMWTGVASSRAVRLEGTAAGLALLVLGLCALWALGGTVRAAAVRAAWIRSRTPPSGA